jgi:hypothetical protein
VLRTIGAVACAAALVTGSAAAEGSDWASASLSSVHGGTRPVAFIVSLHTELQCGKLRGGALAITFPAASRLPKAIGAAAISVGGREPTSVKLAGRTLSISMPPPIEVICDSIAPGTAKILVSRAAHVGNPAVAGSYNLVVHYRTESLRAKFTIKA